MTQPICENKANFAVTIVYKDSYGFSPVRRNPRAPKCAKARRRAPECAIALIAFANRRNEPTAIWAKPVPLDAEDPEPATSLRGSRA